MAQVILASGSPIRRQLLSDAGLVFAVHAADIDEAREPQETPWQMADRLAREKALAVSAQFPKALVIGSDQAGQTDAGVELRKCWDEQAATTQLMAMAGRAHTFRAAAAIAQGGAIVAEVAQEATVRFRAYDRASVERYLCSGQWRGSAGSYTLEGRGVQFIEAIEGSHHAVFGLPLIPLLSALRDQGALA